MTERALVIGASGGIGAALAAQGEGRGCEVTRLSRSGDGLDLTDPTSVAHHLGALEGRFDWVWIATGALTATGAGPEKALKQLRAEELAGQFALNAMGPALVLAHVAALIPRNRPARIGILSARVGSIGDNRMGGWMSYRASKAALNQVIRCAAIELGRSHRQAVIAALHPGTVATSFTADYPDHDKLSPDDSAARLWDVLAALTPAQSGAFRDYAGKEIPW